MPEEPVLRPIPIPSPCTFCHRPLKFGAHYKWCRMLVPQPPPKLCVICKRGPADLAPHEKIENGRCSRCRKLSTAECNEIVYARARAAIEQEMAVDAAERREKHKQEERRHNEAVTKQMLDLLAGAAPQPALGDGSNEIKGPTALVPLVGGSAIAVITQNTGLAEERRRRRAVWEAALRRRDEVWSRTDARLKAVAKELEPYEQQFTAINKQMNLIQNRYEREVVDDVENFSDEDVKRGAIKEPVRMNKKWSVPPTPEDQAELSRLFVQSEASWQKIVVFRRERQRLKKEADAAWDDVDTATSDYRRWCDMEQEIRLDTLNKGKGLDKFCARSGTQIPFDREYCSAECKAKPPFDGIWFPQCTTCGSYFVGDAEGGRGDVPSEDDITYCSYTCLLASAQDLDLWPGADAACWQTAIRVPHPPLTTAARAALARRRLLEDVKHRWASTSSPQPALAGSGALQRYLHYLAQHGPASDAEAATEIPMPLPTVKDVRRKLGDRLVSDGGRPARWGIAPSALGTAIIEHQPLALDTEGEDEPQT